MIKVTRISTHPSKKKHGVGLHSHKISESGFFKTIFITPGLDENDVHIRPKKYTLKVSSIKFKKRPTKSSLIYLFIFHISRIFKLVKFSIYSISVSRKNNSDVVHIHSPMYILIAIWAKFFGKLTCITYHGTDYLRVRNSKLYFIFSNLFIDIGFCISPHMIPIMKKYHKQAIYSPNGIDSSIFINKMEKREKIILAVGALKKEKSYNNLIIAFKKVVNNFPHYSLHIAGEGRLKEELKSLVKKVGLGNNIIFCGNLDKVQLIEKYNIAEAFILSSNSEGFPKVVLEALFTGCKVIATDVGSVSTFLPKKYIIPNDSVDNLYGYIIKIIKEKDYEINIDELKFKYTWLNVTKKYETAYSNYIIRS
jgi:glycosyltransferase involved in cell wall biosynthesis